MKRVRDTNFYRSREWKSKRLYIIQRDRGICQMCGGIVTGRGIVDHIIPLTIDNYKDTSLSLNDDNLQYLCIDCHNKKTFSDEEKNNLISDDGKKINFSNRQDPPSKIFQKNS